METKSIEQESLIELMNQIPANEYFLTSYSGIATIGDRVWYWGAWDDNEKVTIGETGGHTVLEATKQMIKFLKNKNKLRRTETV